MCPQYTDATARTPSLAQGHDPGATVNTLKGLDVGKCHTKFQLSSPEGIKVISCKRNADVNLRLNLQVNLNLVTNVTYAPMLVTSRRNAICPTPAKGRRGHKKVYTQTNIVINYIPPIYFACQGYKYLSYFSTKTYSAILIRSTLVIYF